MLTVMRVKRKISLDRLRKRLKSELKHRYRLMHTDADGDVVEIRNSSTLHALLRDVPDGQTIAITLKRREAGVAVDEGVCSVGFRGKCSVCRELCRAASSRRYEGSESRTSS